jgi:nicotinate dehydrogenase subunit B
MSISVIPQQVEDVLATHRRGFLKTAGLLFVGFASPNTLAADEPGPYPLVDPRKLDSWIVIHANNTATFYVGKTDPGQGTGTGFRQLMSDELDIAFDKTTCIMGSTDITVDQVGAGGSSAMERDSLPMRRAAAEALRSPRGSTGRQRGRDHGERRPLKTRYLWRFDRRPEV